MGINFTLILQCFWVRGSLLRFNTNINKNPCPLKDYLCLKYLFGLHEASGQVGDWARRWEGVKVGKRKFRQQSGTADC